MVLFICGLTRIGSSPCDVLRVEGAGRGFFSAIRRLRQFGYFRPLVGGHLDSLLGGWVGSERSPIYFNPPSPEMPKAHATLLRFGVQGLGFWVWGLGLWVFPP